MDINIVNQVANILAAIVVAGITALVGKFHLDAKQLATAKEIATEGVHFTAQAAEKLGITTDSGKFTLQLSDRINSRIDFEKKQ